MWAADPVLTLSPEAKIHKSLARPEESKKASPGGVSLKIPQNPDRGGA